MNLNAVIPFIVTLCFCTCAGQITRAEILEHPHTQYVLEGNTTSFHCNTIGVESYWRINNETISDSEFNTVVRQKYETQGFVFQLASINRTLGYYNLTMQVSASVEINNTNIDCWVTSSHDHYDSSDVAYLIVFTTFSPGTFSDQAINHTVVFYPNGTPLLTIEIQLPNDLWPNQEVNYTIMIENALPEMFELVKLDGPHIHLGLGKRSHTIMDGIKRDANYSLRVELNSLAGTSTSSRYYFDTILNITHFKLCKPEALLAADFFSYKLALGISLSLAAILLLALLLVFACIILYRKRRMHNKIAKSANNVCNAMVHNPIYDGPVYESVQQQFETLTATTLRAARMTDSDNSVNQPCNSQPSTPTSSEKSVRYVDPPVQLPKMRSKSFVSNDHAHASTSASDAANIPRSTSVSVPVTKKAGKQRNKLNLTLTLDGNDSTGPSAMQNKTCGPISAVNPVVLRDVEDNYTVMSPAGTFTGAAKWIELSPEDTDKYKNDI